MAAAAQTYFGKSLEKLTVAETAMAMILAMARHMGLRVVAEGVETAGQAEFLTASGCECMQGYLFARPAPFDKLAAALG